MDGFLVRSFPGDGVTNRINKRNSRHRGRAMIKRGEFAGKPVGVTSMATAPARNPPAGAGSAFAAGRSAAADNTSVASIDFTRLYLSESPP
jgi:hypothetical protein